MVSSGRTSILLKQSGTSECADLRCDFTETQSCHSCTRRGRRAWTSDGHRMGTDPKWVDNRSKAIIFPHFFLIFFIEFALQARGVAVFLCGRGRPRHLDPKLRGRGSSRDGHEVKSSENKAFRGISNAFRIFSPFSSSFSIMFDHFLMCFCDVGWSRTPRAGSARASWPGPRCV